MFSVNMVAPASSELSEVLIKAEARAATKTATRNGDRYFIAMEIRMNSVSAPSRFGPRAPYATTPIKGDRTPKLRYRTAARKVD
jgi:hypothetical protein